MAILDNAQKNIHLWPDLERPLDQAWVQVAAPRREWPPHSCQMACACFGAGKSWRSHADTPSISEPSFHPVLLEYQVWNDMVDRRRVCVWVGQCKGCKRVYWAMLAEPLVRHDRLKGKKAERTQHGS